MISKLIGQLTANPYEKCRRLSRHLSEIISSVLVLWCFVFKISAHRRFQHNTRVLLKSRRKISGLITQKLKLSRHRWFIHEFGTKTNQNKFLNSIHLCQIVMLLSECADLVFWFLLFLPKWSPAVLVILGQASEWMTVQRQKLNCQWLFRYF